MSVMRCRVDIFYLFSSYSDVMQDPLSQSYLWILPTPTSSTSPPLLYHTLNYRLLNYNTSNSAAVSVSG